jgi:hypothetical protein
MAWTVRDIDLDREIINAIEKQEDRSAAILAAIYLEDRITSTIEAHGVADSRLKTLASKIDAVCRAGLFEKPITDVMHTVRSIRNAFAHDLAPLTFDTPSIADSCKRLYSHEFLRGFKSWIDASLEAHSELLEMTIGLLDPMIASPDTPRNAYMNTVKLMLMLLQLSQVSAIMRDDQYLDVRRGKIT